MAEFVGRSEPLARLLTAYRAATGGEPGAASRGAALVLVTGEAGMGKTSLVRRFTADVEAAGGTVVWGSCWDDAQAPAWWPWTEALRRLDGGAARPPAELGPMLDAGLATDEAASPGGRLRLMAATAGWLAEVSRDRPLVVVLDDLQWSDASTLDLLRFLVRRPADGRLLLVGGYRPGEARSEVAAALAELTVSAELVPLGGLTESEVTDLVRAVEGEATAEKWSPVVHARSGGHPFFARELCRMLAAGADPQSVPPVVRDVVVRRIATLTAPCQRLLDVTAVVGSDAPVDLLAEVSEQDRSMVVDQAAQAVAAAVLAESDAGVSFAHDLYRESVLASLPLPRRAELHARIGTVLAARRTRGGHVRPADLARHTVAALPATGSAGLADAVAWAREAAAAEESRYAFAEAVEHLARVRRVVAEAGLELAVPESVRLTVAEADLRLKAGEGPVAQRLFDDAWAQAQGLVDAELMGAVALGLDRCGAQFGKRRDRLLGVLEAAREALDGTGSAAEAQLTAALARQLNHSVPADRPRARPLAEAAVEIARELDDPRTLATCLVAQHDSIWTPGTAERRIAIAQEVASLARVAGDRERQAQGLLLGASAQLEAGRPSFRATLAEYFAVSRQLRQPGHDYLVKTREAALALLAGDIEGGDRLSVEAAELGEEVGETDTGNVRMVQRLEVVRARGDADGMRAMATDSVDWWVGLPVHAHGVAAGFLAQAGDLEGARRELDTVLSFDDWRSDRSYMWSSSFVGQVTIAAIALGDLALCRQLVDDLRPLRETCGVNAALAVFMGAHAHHLGLLHAALGDRKEAERLLTEALRTHQRLGARAWESATRQALAELETGGVTMSRAGDVWEVGFRGEAAAVRHTKGVQDLAVLVARPGVDVPALELMTGSAAGETPAGHDDQVLDRTALAAYRTRLDELDEELETARADADAGREERASTEREQVLTELRRATRPDGRAKGWDNRNAERARKAVSARIRDGIERIEAVLPELARHLDRSVTTGTSCRYEPRRTESST